MQDNEENEDNESTDGMSLDDLMEGFDHHFDYWKEKHEEMTEEIKFSRLGEQWPASIKKKREDEGRPIVVNNKLPSFARQVINDARQNKPRIRTSPADDKADVKTSEVMNGLIRNIEYTSDADVAYDNGLESAVYCSWGFFRVDLDYTSYDQFDQDIKIGTIMDPTSVYPDTNSQAHDGSDWMRCFISDVIDKETFEAQYPDADVIGGDLSNDYSCDWGDEDNVRVVEGWIREEVDAELVKLTDGQVMLMETFEQHQEQFQEIGITIESTRPTTIFKVTRYLFTGSDILEETEWPGRYIPIVPVYGEDFYADGKRQWKSMFKDALDIQRNLNYWRTAGTEMVANQPRVPFIGPTGAFDTDEDKWATANIDSHPYLQYDGQVAPQREQPPMVSQGILQEIMQADKDLKDIVGIHDAGLGMQSNEIAGVAIDARKTESDTSNFHFVDNLARSMRYAGRILLDLIPHVYSEARTIRVMGHDESVKNVQINQEIQEQGGPRIYDFSKGKYDLTVEVGAGYQTKRKEAVKNMMQLATAYPEVTSIIGDLVAKNMDWDGADEIAKRLKSLLPPEIIAMEEMEDIPEEARPFIANAVQQIEQIQGQLNEKDMVIGQMNDGIKALQMEVQNRQGETEVKKYKIDMDRAIAEMKEDGDQKLEYIKGEVKMQLEGMNNEMKAIADLVNNQMRIRQL